MPDGGKASQEGIQPGELARLASMAIRARVIVEGAFAGLHHNPHTGSAIEFAEHKEYAPGDEIRRIDWKAVARKDRYYVKQYEDETEMRILLVLDASMSMGYGRRGLSKLTYATYLVGALAYLSAKQGDPAGLTVIDSATRAQWPPASKRGQVGQLLRALDDLAPGGDTDLEKALARLGEQTQKRSLIVVFSDLLDAEPGQAAGISKQELASGPVIERLSQLRLRGHDVVVFHILDPDEIELPFEDLTHFSGMEPSDDRRVLADPEDLKASFRDSSKAFRERWRKACLQSRIEYRFVATDAPPAPALRAFLGDRQGSLV